MTFAVEADQNHFVKTLFGIMPEICPCIAHMEPYEFRYAMNNIFPFDQDWSSLKIDSKSELEKRVHSTAFLESVQIKPKIAGQIVLDPGIVSLTNKLFVGLVSGDYDIPWVNSHFYFDPRGFNFLVRSTYVTSNIIQHLGGKPYRVFEPKQKRFERFFEVGYKDFKEANLEVDSLFIQSVLKLCQAKGTPMLLAIAGPTAAGKTEIVDRLREAFEQAGKKIAAIEMDNFLTDRDQREERGIGSFGKGALHFDAFRQCIEEILQGKAISTPRYDFITGTSSHDLNGHLKPGCSPVSIAPADIVFIEGNSPFLLPEIAPLVGVKVVYLTDDAIRLKRKWRRDIDFRKKYDPCYFRNRYFREQPLMAVKNYQPQLMACDVFVDTTGAAFWVTPEIRVSLDSVRP